MKKQKGFTLIELMIVVVIIAILASIAIPSYHSYMQKTRRADAKQSLTAAAAAMEKWFFTNNGYATTATQLGSIGIGADDAVADSGDGHYSIHRVKLDGCTTALATCFALEAKVVAGAQSGDTDCVSMILTNTGSKSATNKKGEVNNHCW